MLDFFIVSDCLMLSKGQCVIDLEAPTRPHSTVSLQIAARPRAVYMWAPVIPKSLSLFEGPLLPWDFYNRCALHFISEGKVGGNMDFDLDDGHIFYGALV